jgi:hypothetical protein
VTRTARAPFFAPSALVCCPSPRPTFGRMPDPWSPFGGQVRARGGATHQRRGGFTSGDLTCTLSFAKQNRTILPERGGFGWGVPKTVGRRGAAAAYVSHRHSVIIEKPPHLIGEGAF